MFHLNADLFLADESERQRIDRFRGLYMEEIEEVYKELGFKDKIELNSKNAFEEYFKNKVR